MGSNDPDYYQVDIPAQKDPEDYTYVERRAEILGLILDKGSPHGIKQARLADRYDVSPSQISQDMDRLRNHVEEHLGRQAKLTTRASYQKTVQKLQEEGEWKKAWDVIMDWNQWLQDTGHQEQEPDKHEISGEIEQQTTEKKMLVGVDIGQFPGVDPDRMVGADFQATEQEGEGEAEELAEDAADIALEGTEGADDAE